MIVKIRKRGYTSWIAFRSPFFVELNYLFFKTAILNSYSLRKLLAGLANAAFMAV